MGFKIHSSIVEFVFGQYSFHCNAIIFHGITDNLYGRKGENKNKFNQNNSNCVSSRVCSMCVLHENARNIRMRVRFSREEDQEVELR